jgi:hypothetical protein
MTPAVALLRPTLSPTLRPTPWLGASRTDTVRCTTAASSRSTTCSPFVFGTGSASLPVATTPVARGTAEGIQSRRFSAGSCESKGEGEGGYLESVGFWPRPAFNEANQPTTQPSSLPRTYAPPHLSARLEPPGRNPVPGRLPTHVYAGFLILISRRTKKVNSGVLRTLWQYGHHPWLSRYSVTRMSFSGTPNVRTNACARGWVPSEPMRTNELTADLWIQTHSHATRLSKISKCLQCVRKSRTF